MIESILTSIKQLLGIGEDYTAFDPDVTMDINMAFVRLNQLGVGPTTGYRVTDKSQTWSDFTSRKDIDSIITYTYLKVRLVFDPPQNSFLVKSIEDRIDELEWSINTQVEEGHNE